MKQPPQPPRLKSCFLVGGILFSRYKKLQKVGLVGGSCSSKVIPGLWCLLLNLFPVYLGASSLCPVLSLSWCYPWCHLKSRIDVSTVLHWDLWVFGTKCVFPPFGLFMWSILSQTEGLTGHLFISQHKSDFRVSIWVGKSLPSVATGILLKVQIFGSLFQTYWIIKLWCALP